MTYVAYVAHLGDMLYINPRYYLLHAYEWRSAMPTTAQKKTNARKKSKGVSVRFWLDEDTHKQLKLTALSEDKTLQDYIAEMAREHIASRKK